MQLFGILNLLRKTQRSILLWGGYMQVHRKCWQGIIILLQLLLIYGQNQIRDESTIERQPMQRPISALVQ